MDYPNINNLVDELNIDENDIFTSFTNSSLYSPFGLEATAPVFSSSSFPQLASPIGQVAASAKLFERIPLWDRATVAGLLLALLDFDRDEMTFEAYDRMTAHELFIRLGVSKRLVDDFLRPTLLVGLFKPPEELSAAVALEVTFRRHGFHPQDIAYFFFYDTAALLLRLGPSDVIRRALDASGLRLL